MQLDRVEAIRKTPLFASLQPNELERLAESAVEQKLGRGEILFLAGEPAKGLYVIVEGSVRAYRVGVDGREQVIHVERAGTTIAEVPCFDEGAYPSTVAGEEDSLLLFIARIEVQRLYLDHPRMALSALRVMAARLRKCARLVETLSLHDVDRRLARLLLAEAHERGRRTGTGWRIDDFLMTHQQVASRIGTVREVVSRAFSRLQQAGLVRIEAKSVHLPDERGLRQYVEG